MVGHAGGSQQGPCNELTAIGEGQMLVPAINRDGGNFERQQKLGPKALRLSERSARQFAAADARRKAEIIFDPRTRAGLAARGVPVEQ